MGGLVLQQPTSRTDIQSHMLLLDTESLWPGLVAAAPVRHPGRPEIELVMPDVPLDVGIIASLKRLGVPSMWVRWPGLDFVDSMVSQKVENLRRDVFTALKQDFEACQAITVGVAHYMRYRGLVCQLIIELLRQDQSGCGVQTAGLFDRGQGLFSHCANVTYLSLTLGLRIEDYIVRERRWAARNIARDLTNLGIGAMLHDIGKLDAPPPPGPEGNSTEQTWKAYLQHPYRGYEMIRDRVSATARSVVLHHHQRFDGLGFPDMATVTDGRRHGPLRGRHIHVFARIAGLCDMVEHLCHDKDDNPRPPVAALHDILAPEMIVRFDPVILRGLLIHLPPFTLGSRVTLSDGGQCAVIAISRLDPCRPTVRRLDCKDPATRDIDLAKHPKLHIRSHLGINVEPWLFEVPASIAHLRRIVPADETPDEPIDEQEDQPEDQPADEAPANPEATEPIDAPQERNDPAGAGQN